MKILLVNLDSKIPNLALAKIEKYHLDLGHEIIRDLPLAAPIADKIYVSCIYTWNRWQCAFWEGRAEIGGSGYDLKKTLPPEIERVKPRINIGFTTRGCIRRCPFCLVSRKEGNIRVIGDIYDIWDGESKEITLLDNNILADRDHFFFISHQIQREKLKIDLNQGLDIRLIDDDIAHELSHLKYSKQLRFAWDEMKYEKEFRKGIGIITKYIKPSRIMVYMLVGFNTTFQEDMYRLKAIREYGCDPFVMLYDKTENRLLRELARWANRFYFRNRSFEDFFKSRNYSFLITEERVKDGH